MFPRKRKRDFAPLGNVGWDRLGLPARRARELGLAVTWRNVAGEAIARRALPLAIRRSVLEVRLVDADPGWSGTVQEVLPELARRIAAEFPALGVRRIRLLSASGEVLRLVDTGRSGTATARRGRPARRSGPPPA